MSTALTERIGLFIDGISLQHAANVLQMKLDFKRLLQLFQQRGHLVGANYYSVIPPQPAADTAKPLLDWLSYNGFNVLARSSPHAGDAENILSLAVDISVDAMQRAAHLDHVVLISACRELQSLICALKTMGRRVSVVSTMRGHSTPDELRRHADIFLDLEELRPIIAAEPKLV